MSFPGGHGGLFLVGVSAEVVSEDPSVCEEVVSEDPEEVVGEGPCFLFFDPEPEPGGLRRRLFTLVGDSAEDVSVSGPSFLFFGVMVGEDSNGKFEESYIGISPATSFIFLKEV